ncbi:MAG: Formiminotransferase-cyclodeaminase, partial [Nocardioidaceae bacterium]|nr:Formiminotransferase-cyclodeaminase [Nocardioidaceae bacterium]
MATMSYLGQELGDFLDLVASREAAPGGGAVAAITISLAAGLVGMAAQLSERQVPDSA